MSDLRELYQEVILDHNKNPRNFGHLDRKNREADGHNPLCGDQLHLELLVEGDRIVDARFEGRGCAISTASASIMTDSLKGRTLGEVEALFEQFHDLVTKGPGSADADLGKLVIFGGVAEFPARVKCATLAWHTLLVALKDEGTVATTE